MGWELWFDTVERLGDKSYPVGFQEQTHVSGGSHRIGQMLQNLQRKQDVKILS
jgi:hypothetical protein